LRVFLVDIDDTPQPDFDARRYKRVSRSCYDNSTGKEKCRWKFEIVRRQHYSIAILPSLCSDNCERNVSSSASSIRTFSVPSLVLSLSSTHNAVNGGSKRSTVCHLLLFVDWGPSTLSQPQRSVTHVVTLQPMGHIRLRKRATGPSSAKGELPMDRHFSLWKNWSSCAAGISIVDASSKRPRCCNRGQCRANGSRDRRVSWDWGRGPRSLLSLSVSSEGHFEAISSMSSNCRKSRCWSAILKIVILEQERRGLKVSNVIWVSSRMPPEYSMDDKQNLVRSRQFSATTTDSSCTSDSPSEESDVIRRTVRFEGKKGDFRNLVTCEKDVTMARWCNDGKAPSAKEGWSSNVFTHLLFDWSISARLDRCESFSITLDVSQDGGRAIIWRFGRSWMSSSMLFSISYIWPLSRNSRRVSMGIRWAISSKYEDR